MIHNLFKKQNINVGSLLTDKEVLIHTNINKKGMKSNARKYAYGDYTKIPKQCLNRFKKFGFNRIELNSYLAYKYD